MPIAAREALHVGTRVAYEDAANPRREGRIAEVIGRGGTTPSGLALPTGDEYRVVWDEPREGAEDETTSDLRQYGWHQIADLPGNPFDGADIIAAYTRERAHADGELVALDGIAAEAGFSIPVSLTRPLGNLVEPTEAEREQGQSTNGRLWDVLSMARFGILARSRAGKSGDAFDYEVIFANRGRGRADSGRRTKRLRFHVGPGDQGEPVVTIGFPEDF